MWVDNIHSLLFRHNSLQASKTSSSSAGKIDPNQLRRKKWEEIIQFWSLISLISGSRNALAKKWRILLKTFERRRFENLFLLHPMIFPLPYLLRLQYLWLSQLRRRKRFLFLQSSFLIQFLRWIILPYLPFQLLLFLLRKKKLINLLQLQFLVLNQFLPLMLLIPYPLSTVIHLNLIHLTPLLFLSPSLHWESLEWL